MLRWRVLNDIEETDDLLNRVLVEETDDVVEDGDKDDPVANNDKTPTRRSKRKRNPSFAGQARKPRAESSATHTLLENEKEASNVEVEEAKAAKLFDKAVRKHAASKANEDMWIAARMIYNALYDNILLENPQLKLGPKIRMLAQYNLAKMDEETCQFEDALEKLVDLSERAHDEPDLWCRIALLCKDDMKYLKLCRFACEQALHQSQANHLPMQWNIIKLLLMTTFAMGDHNACKSVCNQVIALDNHARVPWLFKLLLHQVEKKELPRIPDNLVGKFDQSDLDISRKAIEIYQFNLGRGPTMETTARETQSIHLYHAGLCDVLREIVQEYGKWTFSFEPLHIIHLSITALDSSTAAPLSQSTEDAITSESAVTQEVRDENNNQPKKTSRPKRARKVGALTVEDMWKQIICVSHGIDNPNDDDVEESMGIFEKQYQELASDNSVNFSMNSKRKTQRGKPSKRAALERNSVEEVEIVKSIVDKVSAATSQDWLLTFLEQSYTLPLVSENLEEICEYLNDAYRLLLLNGITLESFPKTESTCASLFQQAEMLYNQFIQDNGESDYIRLSLQLWRTAKSILDSIRFETLLFPQMSAKSQWMAANYLLSQTDQIDEPLICLESCLEWVLSSGDICLVGDVVTKERVQQKISYAKSRCMLSEIRKKISSFDDEQLCDPEYKKSFEDIFGQVMDEFASGSLTWKYLAGDGDYEMLNWVSRFGKICGRETQAVYMCTRLCLVPRNDASSTQRHPMEKAVEMIGNHLEMLLQVDCNWSEFVEVVAKSVFVAHTPEKFVHGVHKIACVVGEEAQLSKMFRHAISRASFDFLPRQSMSENGVSETCAVILPFLEIDTHSDLVLILGMGLELIQNVKGNFKGRAVHHKLLMTILERVVSANVKLLQEKCVCKFLRIAKIIVQILYVDFGMTPPKYYLLMTMARKLCSVSFVGMIHDEPPSVMNYHQERKTLIESIIEAIYGIDLSNKSEHKLPVIFNAENFKTMTSKFPSTQLVFKTDPVSDVKWQDVGKRFASEHSWMLRYILNVLHHHFLDDIEAFAKKNSNFAQWVGYCAVAFANGHGFGGHLPFVDSILKRGDDAFVIPPLNALALPKSVDQVDIVEVCERFAEYYGNVLHIQNPTRTGQQMKVKSYKTDIWTQYSESLEKRILCNTLDVSFNPWKADGWRKLGGAKLDMLHYLLSSPEMCVNILDLYIFHVEFGHKYSMKGLLPDSIRPSREALNDEIVSLFKEAVHALTFSHFILNGEVQMYKDNLEIGPVRSRSRVEVKYSDDEWYYGTITRVNDDDTFDVAYSRRDIQGEDDDNEMYDYSIPRADVRIREGDTRADVQGQETDFEVAMATNSKLQGDFLYANLSWLKRFDPDLYTSSRQLCRTSYETAERLTNGFDERVAKPAQRAEIMFMKARVLEKMAATCDEFKAVIEIYADLVNRQAFPESPSETSKLSHRHSLYRLHVTRYKMLQVFPKELSFIAEHGYNRPSDMNPSIEWAIHDIAEAVRYCAECEGPGPCSQAVLRYAQLLFDKKDYFENWSADAFDIMQKLFNYSYKESSSPYCVVFYTEFSAPYENITRPWGKIELRRYRIVELYAKICCECFEFTKAYELLRRLVYPAKSMKQDTYIGTLSRSFEVLVKCMNEIVERMISESASQEDVLEYAYKTYYLCKAIITQRDEAKTQEMMKTSGALLVKANSLGGGDENTKSSELDADTIAKSCERKWSVRLR